MQGLFALIYKRVQAEREERCKHFYRHYSDGAYF